MKLIIVILLSVLTSVALAKPEDRLRELVKKDVQSKLHGGAGLSKEEKKEYDSLSDELGLFTTSQLTNEAMNEIRDTAAPTALRNEAATNQQQAPDLKKILSPKPVVTQAPVSKPVSAPVVAPKLEKTVEVQAQVPKELPKKDVPAQEQKSETPNITVVINQPGSPPMVSTTGQSPDATTSGAAASNQAIADKKPEAPPKPERDPLLPVINKETEKRMLKNYRDVASRAAEESNVTDNSPKGSPVHGDQIYSPSPVGQGVPRPGFVVQRDSTSIVTYSVSVNDSVTIETCVADGVSVNLDESIKTKIQNVIISDDRFFTYKLLENKRGVFVRLQRAVPEGGAWLSSLRLYRAEDDKAYLVNLIGLPCPQGVIKFPKVVYLTEKVNRNARLDDKYKLGDTEVLTPEDTIIAASYGYDMTEAYNVKVYDMVASAGAKVISLGVELNSVSEPDDGEFKVLDYHQISQIKTSFKYLELQSKKATSIRGQKVQRFNLTVSVDKDYILTRKYVYLMYINAKKKNYEYIRVDLAQYLKSLKDRGFDL